MNDDLKCTYPRCRQVVAYGTGIQVEREGGKVDRYCQRHWELYCKERAREDYSRAVADHNELEQA